MLDVIVIGLGAMGSAGLYALARSGLQVLGLDRYSPPHTLGSSHGQTRVIREAYFEDPAYVPLLQAAYTHWQALEQASGQELMFLTGGVMIGPAQGNLIQGCRQSAQHWQLPHQELSATQLMQRYPAFVLPEQMQAIWEPRAGLLYPERCIQAFLAQAQQQGARIQTQTQVHTWERHPAGSYTVHTSQGSFSARQLVFCAGAWLQTLIPALSLPLQVTRQTLFWFESSGNRDFQAEHLPIFLLEYAPETYLYGFPDLGQGFKVAIHVPGSNLEPEALAQEHVTEHEIQEMQALLQTYFPAVSGPVVNSAVCLYTNTPDQHFIFDTHPQDPNILLVSPCSGHGFKFSAVIGELIASHCTGQVSGFDLSLFRLGRFDSSV